MAKNLFDVIRKVLVEDEAFNAVDDVPVKPMDKEKGEADKTDASDAEKITKEIEFKFKIKEDVGQTSVGDEGTKRIVIAGENVKKIATELWEGITKSIDVNVLKTKKAETALKFFLEIDFSIESTGAQQKIRVYFDVSESQDNPFEIQGWTLNDIVSSKKELGELDEKLSSLFKSTFSV